MFLPRSVGIFSHREVKISSISKRWEASLQPIHLLKIHLTRLLIILEDTEKGEIVMQTESLKSNTQTIFLTPQEEIRFLQLLENPPAMNSKLSKAIERYKRIKEDNSKI